VYGFGPFTLGPEPKPLPATQASFGLRPEVTWTSAGYSAVGILPTTCQARPRFDFALRSAPALRTIGRAVVSDTSARSSAPALATTKPRPLGVTVSATGEAPSPCGSSTLMVRSTVMLVVLTTATWSALAIAT
jgi:hypothetical protein